MALRNIIFNVLFVRSAILLLYAAWDISCWLVLNGLVSPANERLSSSEASQSEARAGMRLSTGLVSAYNVYCIQTGRCHVLCPVQWQWWQSPARPRHSLASQSSSERRGDGDPGCCMSSSSLPCLERERATQEILETNHHLTLCVCDLGSPFPAASLSPTDSSIRVFMSPSPTWLGAVSVPG